MEELVSADKVRKGHYIYNPLPSKGYGPWAEVTSIQREGSYILIKTANWSIRRNEKEGVTVLFDIERELA